MERIMADAESDVSESESFTSNAENVKLVLTNLASTKIPPPAGQKLADLVVLGLKCLEDGFHQVSFKTGGRVEISMNFMATVKASLTQICI
jgi:hypothetical protein